MKGIIRLGDSTTHGGMVIQASSQMTIEGKPAALVGDLVSCPITGHGFGKRIFQVYLIAYFFSLGI